MPLLYAPRQKAEGREEGPEFTASSMAKPTSGELLISSLVGTITLSVVWSGKEEREEQLNKSTGDIGWHIGIVLELVIWAGMWWNSGELLTTQSFEICTSHAQKMACV